MKKIIIDTDPGIDDALAICYAFAHPSLELMALTTVFGNVSASLAAQNALRLCELCHQSVPVAVGASKPLSINPHPVADFVHGENGFGNVDLPAPNSKPVDLSAAELIVKLIREHPGEITLIAVGPLTNIAVALQMAPDITDKVAEVIIMGGTIYHEGNVSPFAEANIWNDPHAAQTVLTANWPLTLHGLDVTREVVFSREYLDNIASACPLPGQFLRDSSEFYIKFYESKQRIENGCCPHDHVALAYITHPEWYTMESGDHDLDVIIEGEQIGRTILNTDLPPKLSANTGTTRAKKQVAIAVDTDKLLQDYADVLSAAQSTVS